jgi:hypothetical protein
VIGRWLAQDRINQGFDDALFGQDHAHAANGDTYVVPDTAWSDTGPQGPGYYVGGEKLQVDQ